jgi:hypothetical protein
MDGDKPEDIYRCACEFAQMAGIELEDALKRICQRSLPD